MLNVDIRQILQRSPENVDNLGAYCDVRFSI